VTTNTVTWLPSGEKTSLLASGAPRYQHVGQVLLFQEPQGRGHWSQIQTIHGTQIGSYFGGELCGVDVDQDGETELLLIGAPLFYGEQRGGRVFIYQRKQLGFEEVAELQGDPGYPLGRFGEAITALTDINGDGLVDVAVGAPLEEQGAVYIFNGRHGGLSPQSSQRIEGTQVLSGVRSRPVVDVVTLMSFSPAEIPVHEVECSYSTSNKMKEGVNITICFQIKSLIPQFQGRLVANLTYTLQLDGHRTRRRGLFPGGRHELRRNIAATTTMSCTDFSFHFPIPFEKNCGEDKKCEANLRVSFSPARSRALRLTAFASLSVELSLSNLGEDAYWVQLDLHFPRELSFRKVEMLKEPPVPCRYEDLERLPDTAEPCLPGALFRCPVVFRQEILIQVIGTLELVGEIEASSMFSLCSSLSISFNSSRHFHLYGSNASLAQVTHESTHPRKAKGERPWWGRIGDEVGIKSVHYFT
ncbi:hypothetical protein H8959_017739, partial [Pygathrix nigripes]